ncbi:MAG: DNA polymerase III subunit gamma/tau [Campylobacterota bacterium]|nr:DNA polymerase III subunit gamma/tau [Campylobacterota bacterium]
MKASSEVLARKYRPKNFNELIGQETISQTLSLALDSNRLSHAYLFSGLRGSGKTSTARIFAKALICEKGVSHNPCGVCQHCEMAIQNRHIDIVEMDAASSRKIDDIRHLIEQTKYKPSIARYKIFIIDEVHMLTKEAFNALLKTLEEPPAYVKFILATTDPLKLPATILSRTQHFRFKRIAVNKIIDHLVNILHKEQIEYELNALEILARSGNGSLRDTLTLLDQAIIYSKNLVDVQTVTDMLGLVDPKFIDDLFNAVFQKDYAKLIQYTKFLEDYEPEMVVDELIAYIKEKMYNQDPIFSTLIIERFFRILSDSKSLFAINADGSFVLSLLFFKMVEALRIKEIDQMIESLEKEIKIPEIKSSTIKKIPETKVKEETPKEIVKEVKTNNLFQELIAKIKDRNYNLGEVFENSVCFISYENNILSWESCANDDAKKSLKHGYSAIKQLVREIYGFETKIKGLPCSKPVVDSMIEEVELGGSSSCVANCSQTDESTKEIDGEDIKSEPMVKKAMELFEATKITIQSKI